MNESLVWEFLEKKNLTNEFKDFVSTRQSSMKNLRYDLRIMIGDADFWVDASFIITKDDKEFLKEWSKTLRVNKEIFSTGYENSEKAFRGEMLQNLFNDYNGYLEGKGYCSGTSYDVEPTDDEPGDDEEYIYESLEDYLGDCYEDFDENLMKLFEKTSFYESIKDN